MNLNFKAISLSYKNAPIEVRESVALNEDESRNLLLRIREELNIQEVLSISTCNRTEVYYVSNDNLSQELVSLLCEEKNIPNAKQYYSYFTDLDSSQLAVNHLYRVAAGLESQVVGDLQISNQVKKSYQLTSDLGLAGPFLHRILHSIFFTNKRIVQETHFRDGAASVSYAVAEMIEEIFIGNRNAKILILGLGEIGEDVARNLSNTHFKNIVVCNRTFEKAQKIAEECQFAVANFDEVWHQIAEADVIISSVGVKEPFLTKEKLKSHHGLTFKYIFDLSVPRSVEEDIEDVNGIVLYNIDEIHSRTSEALERRKRAIPHVESIVNQSIEELMDWTNEMMLSPTIQKFKNALEQIRMEEVARYTKQSDEEEIQKIDKITKGILQKIIKLPVLQLKAACRRGDADNLAEVLIDLFDLERQNVRL